MSNYASKIGTQGPTTRRTLHQGKIAFKRQPPEMLEPVLAELTQRGYIRPVERTTSKLGRPRSREYEVNPAVAGGRR